MAIKLDFTQHSIVIVCDKCPGYRQLRLDRVSAWAAASTHERAAHDGEKQATLAFGMAKRAELQANLARQAQRLNPYVSS